MPHPITHLPFDAAYVHTHHKPDRQFDDAAPQFHPVTFPGFVAGKRLFPGNVIAGYSADPSEYDADSWAQHVLEQGKGFSACTSVLTFSAINSGSTGGRFWFGYVFRGGPVTAADFELAEGVEGSRAFSV